MNIYEISYDARSAPPPSPPLEKSLTPLRHLAQGALTFLQTLYAPRQAFASAVPRATWAVPFVVLFVAILVFGIGDIVSTLNKLAAAQGPQFANAEMRRLQMLRAVQVLGGIVLVFPLMLLMRTALMAFWVRSVISVFGTAAAPDYRQVLTVSSYSLSPLIVQFAVAFTFIHLHLLDTAQLSAIKSLPSLTTRPGLEIIVSALGGKPGYGLASALALCNPFELWKYGLIFLGLRAVCRVRTVTAFVAVLTSFVIEALIVIGLFSALS